VHIPDHFDESDAESETLSEKLRKIDAYHEVGQGGSQVDEEQSNQQVWYMEVDSNEEATNQAMNIEILNQNKIKFLSPDINTSIFPNSQEINQTEKEVAAADVINSQESVITDDGQISSVVIGAAMNDEKTKDDGQAGISQPERSDEKTREGGQVGTLQPERRSERLKKDVHLTTMEKNEALAKKRSLEGNSNKSHTLASIDNNMLNDLAKNMGVLINDTEFSTFDMLKELETIRNCLHLKLTNQSKLNSCVEIVEFVPDENQAKSIDSCEEESEVEEMLSQQSKEKCKFGKKKRFSFSQGGRKQD